MKRGKECCECGYDSDQIEMKPCPRCGRTVCEECWIQKIHRCDTEKEWHVLESFEEDGSFECPNCNELITDDESFYSEYLDSWVCMECHSEAEFENENWMDGFGEW